MLNAVAPNHPLHLQPHLSGPTTFRSPTLTLHLLSSSLSKRIQHVLAEAGRNEMDLGGQDQYRPKHNMSSHATLSPSPFHFGPLDPRSFPASEQQPPVFERRRMSHPHNQAGRGSWSQDNASNAAPPHRPSLEHRTSQTVIDLTDDSEAVVLGHRPALLPPSVPALRRPPQLARSQRMNLQIIDLTADGEDDIQILHSRSVAVPAAAPIHARPPRPYHHRIIPPQRIRNDSPLFVPDENHHHHHHHHRHLPSAAEAFRQMMSVPQFVNDLFGAAANVPHQHHLMPNLEYDQPAFARADQKPDHRPPAAAQNGFTRSPTEDDVIICPACEGELVYEPGGDLEKAPGIKKGTTKQINRKEREEHPFWVVKECGHVYCNTCHQGRKTNPRFNGEMKKGKAQCCVEGCKTEVGNKGAWVGVFL